MAEHKMERLARVVAHLGGAGGVAGPYFPTRSPVLSAYGAVASSQPLASQIGLSILEQGGNACDACVGIAAALNVTEPSSTGIGGDCFCLFYDAKTKKVSGLNGSGRAPKGLSIESLRARMKSELPKNGPIPWNSIHATTVPGAAAGWCDSLERFGTWPISKVLAPSIELAEGGFPVHPWSANGWGHPESMALLTDPKNPGGKEFLLNGRAPVAGEIMRNPTLAQTFREVAKHGKAGFYQGRVAKAIVDTSNALGGFMTLEDLASHRSTFDEPISVNYHGVDVWEIPPNGQGITALMALNMLEHMPKDEASSEYGSAEYFHRMIEAMRIAFADTRYYVADPEHAHVPVREMLSKDYARERAKNFSATKASCDVKRGSPVNMCNTCSFCAVDRDGNACSFIVSNYKGFGTGIVPPGCGFTLQNRGCNFSLDPSHANALQPGKRPYHTIIPGMATKDGELYCPFSVMGGFMQPQGHVQVMLAMIDHNLDPQRTLDLPRFCISSGEAGGEVCVEDTLPEHVIHALRAKGHTIHVLSGWDRSMFGRGQIIRKMPNGVLWAGSDGRADGCALGLSH